jgi:predicted permease
MNPNWNQIVREHLAALHLPAEREIEIVEELAQHFEAVYEDALAAGLAEAEAEARAVQSYDWRLLECELSRAEQPLATRTLQPALELIERRGGIQMESFLQDLRFGARMLFKNPGFTLIAVLTLGLGIGANTAIFSLVNAVFLRQLPVSDPQQLIFGFSGTRNSPWQTISYPNYLAYRDRHNVFTGLAAYSAITVSLNSEERPDLVRGYVVTGNYFDVLGVPAALGRALSPADDQVPNGHPVAVISHRLWQRRFKSANNIIGQQLLVNGHNFTVIGVAPAGFEGAELLETSDLYVPMMMQSVVRPPRGGFAGEMNPDMLGRRGGGWLRMLGRLRPSISMAQAQASLASIDAQLAEAFPGTNRDNQVTLFSVSQIDPRGYRLLWSAGALLLTVTGLVLLIACANVMNLLLSRASARRKEIAVRLALGAGRGRIVRQLLTESVLLAGLGGVSGVLLAVWAVHLLQSTPPPVGIFSFNLDFSLDGRVLGFACALSLLTGIVFGLAPAWQAASPDLVPVLKDETYMSVPGGRRFNLRSALVVVQVSLSLVLLLCAGLFLRSLQRIQNVDPGFDAERVLSASLDINLLRYTTPQGRTFYQEVRERIESLPGVQVASLARVVPISGGGRQTNLVLEGQAAAPEGMRDANNPLFCATNVVGLRYFETMGIALLHGRDFTAQDAAGAPGVVIVSEAFAHRYFNDRNPVGQRIGLGFPQPSSREIIGVVRDSKYRALSEDPQPFIYQPLAQNHETGMTLLVRTAGDPLHAIAGVRQAAQSLEKNLPLNDLQPLNQLLASALYPARMGALLLLILGVLALLLAAIGLYGVLTYNVTQRTREVGVRMALGAQPRDVLRLVLREAMSLVAIGITIGWLGAVALARLLAGFLFGISTLDPVTFVAVPLLLTVVAMLACWIPARQATRVEPLTALRHD